MQGGGGGAVLKTFLVTEEGCSHLGASLIPCEGSEHVSRMWWVSRILLQIPEIFTSQKLSCVIILVAFWSVCSNYGRVLV